MNESPQPLRLYGSDISYFTGKLENYFRVKGLDYELLPMRFPADAKRFEKALGVFQMPVVELPDGRLMTDSTKIIQWFEAERPEPAVIPPDPLQRFICLLLEDYADEWLWRPAMHYRWYYPEGAHFAGRHLAADHLGSIPLPGALKRWFMRWRQRGGYTAGDGITAQAVPGVEAIVMRSFDQLQAVFESRPYLFGERPSLADIGFSAPFFRHFALDPVPLEILRRRAPAVLEWVARLWRAQPPSGNWVEGIPEDLGPLLDEVGTHYLPYLNANVEAVAAGRKRFDADIAGVPYRGARYSRYRVWCLAELRAHYEALPDEAREQARTLLSAHHCCEPLWEKTDLPLLPGQEEGLPFRASTKMVGANEKVRI